MVENILNTIETRLPEMTRTQQMIALAILRDPFAATFSTVQSLAASVGVSPASVVRFAQEYADGGFPELQEALQAHIQEITNPIKRMELNFVPNSDDEVLITSIYETQLANLHSTFNRAFLISMLDAENLIRHARHISILGSRGSRSVAYYLAHHLNRVFRNTDLVPDDDRLADIVLRAAEDEVVIIFALPRYSARLFAVAKQLQAAGAKIITVNGSPTSPFVPLSDIPIYVSHRSSDFHNSQLSSMLVAEILISMSINANPETAMENLKRLEGPFSDMSQFVG